LDIFLGF